MSEPAAPPPRRRRTVGRVVAGGVLSWVLVLGGLRAFVVQAEQCGDPTAAELRASADAAVGWFVRNQRDDGAWLYRYDRDTDSDVGGYNITRHAGVTMSLEQAAGAGLAESEAAAASAERGIEWALDRMYEGPGGARSPARATDRSAAGRAPCSPPPSCCAATGLATIATTRCSASSAPSSWR